MRELVSGQQLLGICSLDLECMQLGQTLINLSLSRKFGNLFALFTGLNSKIWLRGLYSIRLRDRMKRILKQENKWLDWELRRAKRWTCRYGTTDSPALEPQLLPDKLQPS